MKAILISIKPQWVSKILNGTKTIEIRKTMPKCDLPIDVYIYCTKDKDILYENVLTNNFYLNLHNPAIGVEKRNGKVVAKFTLNRVEEISYSNSIYMVWNYTTHRACITEKEMVNYLKGKKGYAWYISNLVIFDRPRELGEFNNLCPRKDEKCHLCKYWVYNKIGTYGRCKNELTKAPQNFVYIEVED